MLDYSNITKNQRSNSYIENYNRRIKLKLSKFLYGKSKCKISWPLFLYFIKNEENDVKNANYKLENDVEIKLDFILAYSKENKYKEVEEKYNEIYDEIFNTKINTIINNEEPSYRNWLKFNSFSCRYDTFFLLYAFVLYDRLKAENDNEVIKNYNNITRDTLKMDINDLNKGIWLILNKYKFEQFDLTLYGFKQYYTVMQHIENFISRNN